jgi:hypothetical protein
MKRALTLLTVFLVFLVGVHAADQGTYDLLITEEIDENGVSTIQIKQDVSALGVAETGRQALCQGFDNSRFYDRFRDVQCKALGPIRIIEGTRDLTPEDGFNVNNYFYFDRVSYNVSKNKAFDLLSVDLAPLKGFEEAKEANVVAMDLKISYFIEMPGEVSAEETNYSSLVLRDSQPVGVRLDLVEMSRQDIKQFSVSSNQSRSKFVLSVGVFTVIIILIMLIWSFYFYLKRKTRAFE